MGEETPRATDGPDTVVRTLKAVDGVVVIAWRWIMFVTFIVGAIFVAGSNWKAIQETVEAKQEIMKQIAEMRKDQKEDALARAKLELEVKEHDKKIEDYDKRFQTVYLQIKKMDENMSVMLDRTRKQ